MKLIEVTSKNFKKMVNEFYSNSMFTFEGLDVHDKEGMKKLEEHIKQLGYPKADLIGYWFTGNLMNDYFGLTGDNAYNDDLIFFVIPDFYNPQYKMAIGARWFDDIVSNNTIRQSAINHNTEADFGFVDEDEEE